MAQLRMFEIEAISDKIFERIDETAGELFHNIYDSPTIRELYLEKNHDKKDFLKKLEEYKELVKVFEELFNRRSVLFKELSKSTLYPAHNLYSQGCFEANLKDEGIINKSLQDREIFVIKADIRKNNSFPDAKMIKNDIVLAGNKDISEIVDLLIKKYDLV